MFQRKRPKASPYPSVRKDPRRKPYRAPRKPYVRQLTVSYQIPPSGLEVPFIRLCGRWLADAGFSADDKINVTVRNNTLVIKPIK